MATSQSEIEQHVKRHGVKTLTAADNTGLYCNSNHYSKKTKRIVIAQTSKWSRKTRRVRVKNSIAQHGDVVVVVTTSLQGHEVFTGQLEVDKTYKNGNVVLKGFKGQFYHTPANDGYKLSQCSGSLQLEKLTDDVKARVEKSTAIQKLITAQYALERSFQNNRRSISRLSIDDVQNIKHSLEVATKLINGDLSK